MSIAAFRYDVVITLAMQAAAKKPFSALAVRVAMKIRHRMVIVNDEKSTYQRAKKPLQFQRQTVNTLHV